MKNLMTLVLGLFLIGTVQGKETFSVKKDSKTTSNIVLGNNHELHTSLCSGKTLSVRFNEKITYANHSPKLNNTYLSSDKFLTISSKKVLNNKSKIIVSSKSKDYFIYVNNKKCEKQDLFVKHFNVTLK